MGFWGFGVLEFDVLCHFWLLVKKVIERKCDVRAAQKEMREYGRLRAVLEVKGSSSLMRIRNR